MSEFNISPEFEDKVRKAVSTPGPRPEFVSQLRNELANRPVKMRSRFVLKPVWVIVFVLVVAMLVISAPRFAAALKQLFGYVPGVGLVENTGNLRILAEPVTVTRDGVTLTVTNVFVYEVRVELVYEAAGIDPSNDGSQVDDVSKNPTAFCGGVNIGESPNKDGDALLRLPDGTILERDYTGLYPKNVYAMTPVYQSSVPQNVTEMTMILKCIPWSRLGAVPENWEVPFKLVPVPEGTVVGAPVIDVNATSEPAAEGASVPATSSAAQITSGVKMSLERIVPMDSATVFYFSMDMENKDPSLVSIMPVDVYGIDSLGQKIRLIGNFPWQPFEYHPGSQFEYTSQSKPADGPLTLVVENAVAYYAPLYVDPPQATPDEMSFTFDAGENPQYGQTWDLNKEFEIAGYKLKVTSARAASFDDIKALDFTLDSQGYEYGYEFVVNADPSVKMHVEMDIMSEASICWMTNTASSVPDSSSIHYIQLCRDEYPKGNVRVTIRELSILVEDAWQATWTPLNK